MQAFYFLIQLSPNEFRDGLVSQAAQPLGGCLQLSTSSCLSRVSSARFTFLTSVRSSVLSSGAGRMRMSKTTRSSSVMLSRTWRCCSSDRDWLFELSLEVSTGANGGFQHLEVRVAGLGGHESLGQRLEIDLRRSSAPPGLVGMAMPATEASSTLLMLAITADTSTGLGLSFARMASAMAPRQGARLANSKAAGSSLTAP